MIWTILASLWKPIAALLAILGIYAAGSRNARQKAKNETLRGNIEAMKTRQEIEDDVSQDPDLVSRAKRIGLVRPDK